MVSGTVSRINEMMVTLCGARCISVGPPPSSNIRTRCAVKLKTLPVRKNLFQVRGTGLYLPLLVLRCLSRLP